LLVSADALVVALLALDLVVLLLGCWAATAPAATVATSAAIPSFVVDFMGRLLLVGS
jgi:hypothetical protein